MNYLAYGLLVVIYLFGLVSALKDKQAFTDKYPKDITVYTASFMVIFILLVGFATGLYLVSINWWAGLGYSLFMVFLSFVYSIRVIILEEAVIIRRRSKEQVFEWRHMESLLVRKAKYSYMKISSEGGSQTISIRGIVKLNGLCHSLEDMAIRKNVPFSKSGISFT